MASVIFGRKSKRYDMYLLEVVWKLGFHFVCSI
jgi:hypothetical protein